MEGSDGSRFFWAYPPAFQKWASLESTEYSMYPAEGKYPPRELSDWEWIHCPWYLDTHKWDSPFDEMEKDAFQKLLKSQVPAKMLFEMKQGLLTEVDHSTIQLQVQCKTEVLQVD